MNKVCFESNLLSFKSFLKIIPRVVFLFCQKSISNQPDFFPFCFNALLTSQENALDMKIAMTATMTATLTVLTLMMG